MTGEKGKSGKWIRNQLNTFNSKQHCFSFWTQSLNSRKSSSRVLNSICFKTIIH